VPYPLPPIPPEAWERLPDRAAQAGLEEAARAFWRVPERAEVVAAPGLSTLIARLPHVLGLGRVAIPGPTYNEHAAAFRAAGAAVLDDARPGPLVAVHPNNPDGRTWPASALDGRPLVVVDESFCDPTPDLSHVARTARPGTVVLKSFGKFWGLAGLRLGFAILAPGAAAEGLRDALGPWPVSGPALAVGAAALRNGAWAEGARARLQADAARLDALLAERGARVMGGTSLFRLYEVDDAQAWSERLARSRVLARTFPTRDVAAPGLPATGGWGRVEAAP
jgi:cobalamin biosynthetic protein CobC